MRRHIITTRFSADMNFRFILNPVFLFNTVAEDTGMGGRLICD